MPRSRARSVATQLLVVLALAVGANPAFAGGSVLITRAELSRGAHLTVTSKAFAGSHAIPARFSAEGGNVALPVKWSTGPADTEAYAVVVEDPDAPPAAPFVHWLVWNLPPAVTAIPAGSTADTVTGAAEGRNGTDAVGYFGPQPPQNDPPHHYHLQVFALDQVLSLPSGADRDALAAAMKGHVVGAGEVIGTFRTR